MELRKVRFFHPTKKYRSDEDKKSSIVWWLENADDLRIQGLASKTSNISYFPEMIEKFLVWFEYDEGFEYYEENLRDAVFAICIVKENYHIPKGYYFFYSSDYDGHNGGNDIRCKISFAESYEGLLGKLTEKEYATYLENTEPL